MNASNKLLAYMDIVFGFADKKKSTYRKVAQHYDERTNEHVVVLEYRVRRGTRNDKAVSAKKKTAAESLDLISDINLRANILCAREKDCLATP